MDKDPADDTELVVVTSLGVLLNVTFGVIDLLIENKNISRTEMVGLLRQLRSEAPTYGQGEEMAVELIDGALYRLAETGSARKPARAA